MTEFIIKSFLSSGLLYAVYVLLLEKEKMHHFNRFYLLFSLVFSLLIPFASFDISNEILVGIAPKNIHQLILPSISIAENANGFYTILTVIYVFVTLILSFRFTRNLMEIRQKIKSNIAEKTTGSTLILLNDSVLPHTFLNFIFINKTEFENRKIRAELFTHELTHVRQKHTLDILFIEILKIIFWFNPILILYKKAIQLNHEFLADEKVVKSYNDVPFYQHLLLQNASWNNTFYLASNLNFSLTKKRLIMMTKTTSRSSALLKKLSLLPILGGIILISCSENGDLKISENGKVEVQALTSDEVPSQPEFPGGIAEFNKYVVSNIKLTDQSKPEDIITAFVVMDNGEIANVEVRNATVPEVREQIQKALESSPRWKPGQFKGKPVRIQLHLPVKIRP